MTAIQSAQRVGFLAVVPKLLRGLGADPVVVLQAAGLDAHALDDPEATIPFDAMGRLLKVAVVETKCPYFGLLIGQRIGPASLGLVGELMRHAPTLGVALRDFAVHQHRNARGSLVYLVTQGDQAMFGYAVYQPGVEGFEQISDGAAAAAFNIVRNLIQADRLDGMEMLISRPVPASLEPYRRFFGVKLHFGADQTAALLPRKWLDRPIPGADAHQRAAVEDRIEAYSPAGGLDLLTQVRRAVRVGLLTGRISGAHLASQVQVPRRTLHRRLAAEGLSFQDVLDETRFELAQQLLANTRLGIAEIALILRYADPSVFTRAFVRWARVSPSQWRASSAHADEPPENVPHAMQAMAAPAPVREA